MIRAALAALALLCQTFQQPVAKATGCEIQTVQSFTTACQAQQPVFRARIDLVRVDALVTRDGTPVHGLAASDFEVRDNGVLQRVTAVDAIEAVQLGVVFDASGSMTGDRLALARTATADLLASLQPGDTFSVVAFGDQVGRVAGAETSPGDAARALERVRAAGATALVDAVYAGIIEAGSKPGPKLLLVMTDGRNNASWLQAADVIDVARRLETVIYPVAIGLGAYARRAPERTSQWFPRRPELDHEWKGVVSPSYRTADSVALLRIAAERTGGRQIAAEWDSSLGTVFRGILDEYRQRYILSFTPENVARGDGWHALEVKVKRRGVTIRARTGYWAG